MASLRRLARRVLHDVCERASERACQHALADTRAPLAAAAQRTGNSALLLRRTLSTPVRRVASSSAADEREEESEANDVGARAAAPEAGAATHHDAHPEADASAAGLAEAAGRREREALELAASGDPIACAPRPHLSLWPPLARLRPLPCCPFLVTFSLSRDEPRPRTTNASKCLAWASGSRRSAPARTQTFCVTTSVPLLVLAVMIEPL